MSEKKGLVLRQEQEAEFPAIYDLVRTAFQTAKVSNGAEQNFVTRLRASGNYIPELALVAEDEGKLIGHITPPSHSWPGFISFPSCTWERNVLPS